MELRAWAHTCCWDLQEQRREEDETGTVGLSHSSKRTGRLTFKKLRELFMPQFPH